jgi:hypothetical protein
MSDCRLCYGTGSIKIELSPWDCGGEGYECPGERYSVPCPKCSPEKKVPAKISLGLIRWFMTDPDATEPYYNLPPGTALAWEEFMLDAIEGTTTEVMVPERLAYVLRDITEDESNRW